MTGKPPITAVAPWMGSKRKLSPRIESLLTPRDSLFVPFLGGGAVPLTWEPCRHEVLNDLNRDIVNACAVLATKSLASELYPRLHYTFCSEELYRNSREVVLEPFVGKLGDIDRAYHALVYWWMGRNGIAGTKPHGAGFSARFTPRGGSGGVRWRNFVRSVPWFCRRLERADILNTDGIAMLDKIEDLERTAIYLDPPYIVKAKPYLHDFTESDHRRLAVAVARFDLARVVVSYYPHPLVDELYPDGRWHKIPIITTKNIRNTASRNTASRKTGSVKATELLICNFKPNQPKSSSLLF